MAIAYAARSQPIGALEQRILLLGEPVDDESANRVVAQLHLGR